MKGLFILLLILIFSGCTTVSYESRNGEVLEKYRMTTWFKGVEDLQVIRTPDLFGLTIGSTRTDDDNVFMAVAKILEFYTKTGVPNKE